MNKLIAGQENTFLNFPYYFVNSSKTLILFMFHYQYGNNYQGAVKYSSENKYQALYLQKNENAADQKRIIILIIQTFPKEKSYSPAILYQLLPHK